LCSAPKRLAACGIGAPSAAATPERVLPGAAEPLDEWPVPEAPSAVHAIIGSIGPAAAARVAWVVTKDPDDAQRWLITVAKNNLGPDRQGYAFRLVGRRVQWESAERRRGPGRRRSAASQRRWGSRAIGGASAETLRK